MASSKKARKRRKKRKKRSKFSEMVLHRIDDAEALVGSFEVFKPSILEGLAKRQEPLLKEGETLPDYALSLDLSAREVRLAIDRLVDLDHRHTAHKADHEGLRSERDRLVAEEAYPRLVAVRGSIDSALGREAGRKVHGLVGKTPRRMPRLGVALAGLESYLASPRLNLPKPKNAGFGIGREMWLAQVRAPRKLLAANADALRDARHHDAALRIEKARAMDEFDAVYSHSLRYLKSMMIKARVDQDLLPYLRPLYQRRRMHKRARKKREARAAAKAAAAEAAAAEAAVAEAAVADPAAAEEPGEAAGEPRRTSSKAGRDDGRSTVARWLGKGKGRGSA